LSAAKSEQEEERQGRNVTQASIPNGFVSLVGTGPGSPDLLTLKALQVLKQAEVLIYDRLISSEILELAPSECECCYVGKSPQEHCVPQHEINRLLVDAALAGKRVVRLKGGDPFVFGRGGEEALALAERGIAFEVVPGVSSAIAAAAYAGIPVTHRGIASSFAVITGHEDPHKEESAINWELCARARGTLVFLMGMSRLPQIVEQLIAQGKDAATPVAVIENGTSSLQRTVRGSLSTIVSLAEQEQFASPAVIVVGAVVALRDTLKWFEKRPLFGKHILVTRARRQASKLSAALEAQGARVSELPLIAFCAPTHPEHLSQAVQELALYDWLVFTSANGVEALFSELRAQDLDVRQLAGLRLVAVGSATRDALERRGLGGIITPQNYYAEGLAQELREHMSPGARILLLRAEDARADLPAKLVGAGAVVNDVAAYKTLAVEHDAFELRAALSAQEIDAITFTSSSTVFNLCDLLNKAQGELGDKAPGALLEGLGLYSIGPITSNALRSCGLKPTVEARTSCVDGLVEAIVAYHQGQGE
jgi:uroporphyrinogen III methyltransferase/synthase